MCSMTVIGHRNVTPHKLPGALLVLSAAYHFVVEDYPFLVATKSTIYQ